MRKAGSVFNCQQTVRLRLYGNAHKEPFRKGHAWAARHSATKEGEKSRIDVGRTHHLTGLAIKQHDREPP